MHCVDASCGPKGQLPILEEIIMRKGIKRVQFKVRCCDCRLFVRDTSGRNISAITGEYFMGSCPEGHNDGGSKVFADKLRTCENYEKK